MKRVCRASEGADSAFIGSAYPAVKALGSLQLEYSHIPQGKSTLLEDFASIREEVFSLFFGECKDLERFLGRISRSPRWLR
jgi:hypothetical protein